MKFKTRQFLLLMIIANLCAGVGYYLFFDYIKTQIEDTSVLISKINLGEQRNSRLNKLQNMVKDTEVERQQLSSFLLPGNSAVDFVENIENLAKTSNLKEHTNNISEAPGKPNISKFLQLQITVNGSWQDVMSFLAQLENLPYSITIRNLSLTEEPPVLQPSTKKGGKTVVISQGGWTGGFDISVIESI